MAVTSYGRNKNHKDEIKKNQEKANNSPSYRCAPIKKTVETTVQVVLVDSKSSTRPRLIHEYCLSMYQSIISSLEN